MPTIVGLGNVKIAIYARDHNPPHFHVLTADYAAIVSIDTLEITAADHMDVLRKAWALLNE